MRSAANCRGDAPAAGHGAPAATSVRPDPIRLGRLEDTHDCSTADSVLDKPLGNGSRPLGQVRVSQLLAARLEKCRALWILLGNGIDAMHHGRVQARRLGVA